MPEEGIVWLYDSVLTGCPVVVTPSPLVRISELYLSSCLLCIVFSPLVAMHFVQREVSSLKIIIFNDGG